MSTCHEASTEGRLRPPKTTLHNGAETLRETHVICTSGQAPPSARRTRHQRRPHPRRPRCPRKVSLSNNGSVCSSCKQLSKFNGPVSHYKLNPSSWSCWNAIHTGGGGGTPDEGWGAARCLGLHSTRKARTGRAHGEGRARNSTALRPATAHTAHPHPAI